MSVDWANPSSIGYPVLFGGVLLGSVVPVVPTGAVVGAGAAIATSTDRLNIVAVVLLATLGSLLGDLVTFTAAHGDGALVLPPPVRGTARGGARPVRAPGVAGRGRRPDGARRRAGQDVS